MISITALSDYSYCPRKFALKRMLRKSLLNSQANIRSMLKRQAMLRINSTEQEIANSITHKIPLNDIIAKYKEHNSNILKAEIIKANRLLQKQGMSIKQTFDRLWPFFARDALLRAYNLNAYVQQGFLSDELWQSLSPKIKGFYYLESASLKLFGVADYIKIYNDRIIPLKTSKSRPPAEGAWPNHHLVVGAFIMLINETFGTSISKGQVLYSTIDNIREITLNQYLKEEILSAIAEITSIASSNALPEKTSQAKKCERCWLRQQCYDDSLMGSLQ